MKFLLLILLLAGAGAPLNSRSAQTVCPAATQASDQIVADLVRSPERAATRQKLGLPALAVTRVLNDSQDAALCSRITQIVETRTSNRDWRTRWNPSYYKVNNLYYIVLARKPNNEPAPAGKVYIDLRWTPVYVLDSNLNVIGGIAM